MPFLTKTTVTVQNVNGDTYVHESGTVLSDWEVSDFIRGKIAEGSEWYRERFEPLLEREAHQHRVRVTSEEGPREVDGQEVKPPFDDYVGLHPQEIIMRMNTSSLDKVRQVRLFERGGMNRTQIVNFVSPAEREPWEGYNSASIGDIMEKLAILSPPVVAEVKMYEGAHQQRPAILEYDASEETNQAPAQVTAPGSPAPVQPEPQPAIPQQPVMPAPPGGGEGATPPEQQAADAQPAVAPPPPAAVQMGPPPQ